MAKQDKAKIWLLIVVSFLVSRASFFLVYVIRFVNWDFVSFLNQLNYWDSGWYSTYAEGIANGQVWHTVLSNGQAVWAFFPLYPLLLTAGKYCLPAFQYAWLGSCMNSIFFMLAEYAGASYIQLTRKNTHTAQWYVLLMSFGLCSFYFSVNYTEALFLLLTTLAFLCLKQKRYLWMGLMGAMMSATRNYGIMFVFAVAVDSIENYVKEKQRFSIGGWIKEVFSKPDLVLGTAMVPAGLFAYMFLLKHNVGDGFAFVHAQVAWHGPLAKANGLFLNLWEGLPNGDPMAIAALTGIVIMIAAILRKRFSEVVFPVIVLFISTSFDLISIPRYLIGCFPVVLLFTDLQKNWGKWGRIISFGLIATGEILLVDLWLQHSQALI